LSVTLVIVVPPKRTKTTTVFPGALGVAKAAVAELLPPEFEP
jgi:hypothetical protein